MPNRFAALLIAALLPLLLFKWFIPSPTGQIDVWLMWLGAMIGVGLPLLYAEIGLATRSQQTPLQGMQALTRQADAGTGWRSFAWLSVVLAWVIAALSIDAVSAGALEATRDMGVNLEVPLFALAAVMVIIAGLLSLLGSAPLMMAVALIAIAFIMAIFANLAAWTPPSLTDATWSEWARVVVLALVSVGVGTGLYWFSSPQVSVSGTATIPTNGSPEPAANASKAGRAGRHIASKTVWPIWIMQLLVGSLALVFNVGSLPAIATFVYTLGVIAAAAFLIHYASGQMASRLGKFGIWLATLISMLSTVVMVVVANPAMLSNVLIVLSLLSALILALFAGWKMKISHMRKSLNFKSESFYNLWRMAIRILTPLLIISAIIGFVIGW